MTKIKRWFRYFLRRPKPIQWVTLVNPTDKPIPLYDMGDWVQVLPDEIFFAHRSREFELTQEHNLVVLNAPIRYPQTPEEALASEDNFRPAISE